MLQSKRLKETKTYDLFNQILEAKIIKINEADSTQQQKSSSIIPIIMQASGKYIQGLPQDGEYAKYKTALEQSVAAAGAEFDKNKKLSDTTLKNVFDIIWQWAIKAHKTEQRKVTTGEKPRYSSGQSGADQSAPLNDQQLENAVRTLKTRYSGQWEQVAGNETAKRTLIRELQKIKNSLVSAGVKSRDVTQPMDLKQADNYLKDLETPLTNSAYKQQLLKLLNNLLKTVE